MTRPSGGGHAEHGRGYKFPKDSSAKILTSGLLGEQYIGIEPGGDTANLASGDTIKMTPSCWKT
jgi:phospholipid/cholesterol/gamma-HCH transport system substrate-binding protein